MDIQLPGLDGYEATRRIKANPALRAIPIIVVTSYALSGDDVKALRGRLRRLRDQAVQPARSSWPRSASTWPAAGGPPVRTPPRILVVDDNAGQRRTSSQTRLAAQGYEIVTATDGEEALRRGRGSTSPT